MTEASGKRVRRLQNAIASDLMIWGKHAGRVMDRLGVSRDGVRAALMEIVATTPDFYLNAHDDDDWRTYRWRGTVQVMRGAWRPLEAWRDRKVYEALQEAIKRRGMQGAPSLIYPKPEDEERQSAETFRRRLWRLCRRLIKGNQRCD